jgi:hypothetical protein
MRVSSPHNALVMLYPQKRRRLGEPQSWTQRLEEISFASALGIEPQLYSL